MTITLISFISLTAWIYLIAFRGDFWRSGPELEVRIPSGKSTIAVIVPARNEAASIRKSLTSLLSQNYTGSMSVILVDDNSTDETATIARSLDEFDRLIILQGTELLAGWSGKLWAIHQGLAHVTAQRADFILLTDADIVHAPMHLSALVAKAEHEGLDLVSEMVRLNCATIVEYSLMPAFVFFFQMLYPFAWVSDPARPVAGAAGGTMLVRRTTLDRIEGVSRIRNCLIDDCALATTIKATGGRIWLGHATEAVSLRAYAKWREVWDMIARTAYTQLKYSPLRLLGCVIAMAVIYFAAPLLAFFAHGGARIADISSWLLMALAFQPTLRRYGRSTLWSLALPAISLFYLGATVASAFRHHTGRGGGWKDRVYPESRLG